MCKVYNKDVLEATEDLGHRLSGLAMHHEPTFIVGSQIQFGSRFVQFIISAFFLNHLSLFSIVSPGLPPWAGLHHE